MDVLFNYLSYRPHGPEIHFDASHPPIHHNLVASRLSINQSPVPIGNECSRSVHDAQTGIIRLLSLSTMRTSLLC